MSFKLKDAENITKPSYWKFRAVLLFICSGLASIATIVVPLVSNSISEKKEAAIIAGSCAAVALLAGLITWFIGKHRFKDKWTRTTKNSLNRY